MLQIIGWILCVGLFCFGLSIIGNANYRVDNGDGDKKMTEAGNSAAALAIIAALVFAVWLYMQTKPMNDYSYSSSYPSEAAAAEAVAAEAEADAVRDGGL